MLRNPAFRPEMCGFEPPGGVYNHVSGIDIVRVGPDDFCVLEDNCRTPSGVSYMLENREAMLRLRAGAGVEPSHRADLALSRRSCSRRCARSRRPAAAASRRVALLTPGAFNSAYYEHSFLADEMGVELVEGADLFVDDAVVYMRTTEGPKRVDVLYRRIDDEFLDPLAFRPDSLLGVPGLFAAYRAGNVALANAPGTGIADDKGIYPYVPEMIRFYLGEEPAAPERPDLALRRARRARLRARAPARARREGDARLGRLRHADRSGSAARAEIAEFAARLRARPDDYIAQPTLALSTCPTFVEDGHRAAPRRPAPVRAARARDPHRARAGSRASRCASGSLVVNSSQGGGTKDTWVLEG